jgi:hypothetical protein
MAELVRLQRVSCIKHKNPLFSAAIARVNVIIESKTLLKKTEVLCRLIYVRCSLQPLWEVVRAISADHVNLKQTRHPWNYVHA